MAPGMCIITSWSVGAQFMAQRSTLFYMVGSVFCPYLILLNDRRGLEHKKGPGVLMSGTLVVQ